MKFKNPRRETLARLREIKQAATNLISRWDVTSTVYESYTGTYVDERTGQERTFHNSRRVPRQYHEYPENSAAHWRDLYAQAQALMDAAEQLREHAAVEYRRSMERAAELAEQQRV